MTEIRTLLAPNPGLFTGPGTNTYLVVSEGEALVIDPGPRLDDHEGRIVDALADLEPVGVVVTHTHPDHAPLANPLARALDVPALGWAPGPEFEPDARLSEGDAVAVGDARVRVIHTPGHADDHLCFLAGTALFTGDHIMGGSTVIVDDMTRYLASLARLQTVELSRLYPGHGPVIDDPTAVIEYYIEHRLERERQVVDAVRAGAGTVGGIVSEVYSDVDPAYHPLAAMSVAAHLRKLMAEGTVAFTPESADDLWSALVTLIS